MKRLIKDSLRRIGIEIKRCQPIISSDRNKIVSLKSRSEFRGHVLLAYLNSPFLLAKGESLPNSHSNYWETWQMANTFLDLGYNVDVIDRLNEGFTPKKRYEIFVGARTNFEKWAEMLNGDCLKIVHLDAAHWVFNNYASNKRAVDLHRRKGVTIAQESLRILTENWAIECADYATILGNQFTMNTYRFAQKPLFRIPISACATYPWAETKDYEACRKKFLWFGSAGMVHKGLDLVLDAFSDMRDYHLVICGPVEKEKYFVKAFYRELYQSPNIYTYGWVDVDSQDFLNITNNCLGLIFPSCSEGGGGSVLACMHAGLIPIVSYESSVDIDDDFGLTLKTSSIEEIKDAVQRIANLPAEELQRMARRAWEFARANHTQERFAEEYRKAVESICHDLI
jgi:glycosyltransferase involved in cell wall biosynthesis